MKDTEALIPAALIENKICLIRGQKVMLDKDLAELYGIPTFRFNEAVKRNRKRFPADFMFQLTAAEDAALTSQIAISKTGRGGRRTRPYVFTEHGAVMAANILHSDRAVQMSVFVVRAFIKLRNSILESKELRCELDELKQQTNDRFQIVFETLDQLLAVEARPRRKIGFTAKEKHAPYAVKQKTGNQAGREKCVAVGVLNTPAVPD